MLPVVLQHRGARDATSARAPGRQVSLRRLRGNLTCVIRYHSLSFTASELRLIMTMSPCHPSLRPPRPLCLSIPPPSIPTVPITSTIPTIPTFPTIPTIPPSPRMACPPVARKSTGGKTPKKRTAQRNRREWMSGVNGSPGGRQDHKKEAQTGLASLSHPAPPVEGPIRWGGGPCKATRLIVLLYLILPARIDPTGPCSGPSRLASIPRSSPSRPGHHRLARPTILRPCLRDGAPTSRRPHPRPTRSKS